MSSDRPIKFLIFGAAALLAVASGGPARASVSAPILTRPSVGAASVTQVHWEYRHHHRYWVPDRRRRR